MADTSLALSLSPADFAAEATARRARVEAIRDRIVDGVLDAADAVLSDGERVELCLDGIDAFGRACRAVAVELGPIVQRLAKQLAPFIRRQILASVLE